MKHVACVLVVRRGAVLAVSRPDPPLRFALPGGDVERGETPGQAAARELHEETGYCASTLCPIVVIETSTGTIVHFFFAPRVRGRLRSSDEGWARWVEPEVVACRGAAYPREAAFVLRRAGYGFCC